MTFGPVPEGACTNLRSAAQELCRCIREGVTGPRRFDALDACEKALEEADQQSVGERD